MNRGLRTRVELFAVAALDHLEQVQHATDRAEMRKLLVLARDNTVAAIATIDHAETFTAKVQTTTQGE